MKHPNSSLGISLEVIRRIAAGQSLSADLDDCALSHVFSSHSLDTLVTM